ncbi:MAG: DUF4105 domain-containing protein [Tenacibaculum sp.]
MRDKYLIISFFVFFFLVSSNAQSLRLSNFSKISIITYGPGDKLYEKFGHTAIRIKDPMYRLDLVYNYGVFDSSEANFYTNFIKGNMTYRLVRYPFAASLRLYKNDKRWVKEQQLNLNSKQKNTFFYYLENNAIPKNASYFYDPFFNNCSSKPRDIIKKNLGDLVSFKSSFITKKQSIRQLMNKEIGINTWGSLGINLALGNILDKTASAYQYMFLPDYVFAALAVSKIKKNTEEENLVFRTNTLLDYPEKRVKSDTVNPLLVFLVILVFGLYLTFKDNKRKTRTLWFDSFLLSTTGLFGIFIIFLWFFTNHLTASNNFNFLWAFAPNLFIAYFIHKKKPLKWTYKYVQLMLLFLALMLVVQIFKIQQFPYVLLPFYVLLIIRYSYILKTIKNSE